MLIFTTLAKPAATEGLSAVCPECPRHLQLAFLFGTGYLMSELTEDEYADVAANPLGNSLNAVRDELSRALNSAESQDLRDAMRNLLRILLSQEVSEQLDSRTGYRSFCQDLCEIRTRVREDESLNGHLRPLSEAVINQLGDVAIWNAAIVLVRNVATTPPLPPARPSVPGQAADQTPFRYTSAAQQGLDQNAEIVEARLWEETKSHIYRSVRDFFAKYFEHKSWHDLAETTWEEVKSEHDGTRWRQITDPPTEAVMRTWWSNFQSHFLENKEGVRGTYHTSHIPDSFDGIRPHQVDMFSKTTNGAEHNWREVAVVGELKESRHKGKGTDRQLFRYIRDIFAHQPTRLFVHAFSIVKTEMTTWVCDRSGPYCGETFDIHDKPDMFIRIISGYTMMSDEELGLNPYIRRRNDKNVIVATGTDGGRQELVLEPNAMVFQRAIVSRATCCFRATASGKDCVVKFSWVPEKRRPETELLRKAQDNGVEGVARLIASREVTTTRALRQGLHFAESSVSTVRAVRTASSTLSPGSSTTNKRKSSDRESSPSTLSKRRNLDSQQAEVELMTTSEIQDDDDVPFENRILRVVAVSSVGRPINQFHDVSELLHCLQDAVKGHRSLYQQGNILHRDISESNIIITNPNSFTCKGMLIDLDVAHETGDSSSGTRYRTGTLQFMAVGTHEGELHTYRHDLESFLYVLIWVCIRRSWDLKHASKKEREDSLIRCWYHGNHKHIAYHKGAIKEMSSLEKILAEFHTNFEGVKPLCREIRDVLFRRVPLTNPNTIYNKIINAFDRAAREAAERRAHNFRARGPVSYREY